MNDHNAVASEVDARALGGFHPVDLYTWLIAKREESPYPSRQAVLEVVAREEAVPDRRGGFKKLLKGRIA